jgi:hypothetical protein
MYSAHFSWSKPDGEKRTKYIFLSDYLPGVPQRQRVSAQKKKNRK